MAESSLKMISYRLLDELANIQSNLSKKVIRKNYLDEVNTVAGVDVSFPVNNFAVSAAVIVDFNDLKIIEKKTEITNLFFPYISGFLGFREADAIISVIKKLKNNFDALVVDGNGILHPRRFGLASHIGVLLDIPSIGVAKKLIRGAKVKNNKIFYQGEVLGVKVGDVYVSVGHKVSLKTCEQIISKLIRYKVPEPVRLAHILATNTAKNLKVKKRNIYI